MKNYKYIIILCLLMASASTFAQGLEGIIVEKYYSTDAADAADATTEGATVPLTAGSTVFRVYVDMAPGYKFVQVYGSPTHTLTLGSTSNFYNDPNYGVSVDPGTISLLNIAKNTAMIDSWFTTGGVASGKVGVAKTEDADGTVGNTDGLLANNPGSCYGLPITGAGSQDGLTNAILNTYLAPNTLGLGAALDVLDQTPGNNITINNGSIAALGGVVGPTANNRVLIGQFTTSGNLSFALNVQIVNIGTGTPENYVASSPQIGEQTHPSLTQTVTGTCPPIGSNDSPDGATLVNFSSNAAYPNCYPISGDLSTATNSTESSAFSGSDRWYRFVAQSTAVSITLSSNTQDDVIELYEKVGPSYVLMPGGIENASSGASDFERLNYSGLIPGTTYYVSLGANTGSGGTFTFCIQHLMTSGCASVQPVGGFNLCGSYKATYRGAAGQGVSYDFTFLGVGGGASGTTSLSGTNGLITLSNPTLALRYGGVYDVTVNVNYALLNSTNTPENIVVNGTTAAGFCNDVTIRAQPNVEVRANQRCNASLLRSNYLVGSAVAGSPLVCGVLNYTYEFTQVTSCIDGTIIGAATEYTTTGAAPYLPLGVLASLPNNGAWDVRIRPNFSYGNGTYGPVQRIQVSGTSASMMFDEVVLEGSEKMETFGMSNAAIYPNPSNGNMFNVNFTGLESDQVEMRVYDAMGKLVYASNYSVDGSLNTIVSFANPLTSGVYMVELMDGTTIKTEKLVVQL